MKMLIIKLYRLLLNEFEVSDKIPETDEEEEVEVVATVQQAVSYFTSNNNKVSSELRK